MEEYKIAKGIYWKYFGKKRFDFLKKYLEQLDEEQLEMLITRCSCYALYLDFIDIFHKMFTFVFTFISILMVVYSSWMDKVPYDMFINRWDYIMKGTAVLLLIFVVYLGIYFTCIWNIGIQKHKFNYIQSVSETCLKKRIKEKVKTENQNQGHNVRSEAVEPKNRQV